MKTAKDYLKEANSVVEKISPAEGIEQHKSGNLVVVDVRDSSEFPATGTVQGALRIPRGLIEFFADDTHPMHNTALMSPRHPGIVRRLVKVLEGEVNLCTDAPSNSVDSAHAVDSQVS